MGKSAGGSVGVNAEALLVGPIDGLDPLGLGAHQIGDHLAEGAPMLGREAAQFREGVSFDCRGESLFAHRGATVHETHGLRKRRAYATVHA